MYKNKEHQNMLPSFKVADFCCGVGGLRLGFEKYPEFTTVFANDVDKHCKITYELNFGEMTISDINTLDYEKIPQFDILLAGFPCQSFSVAGKRLGFKDKRGNIFFTLIDIIRVKKPRCVFLENVKNLERHDSGKTFKIMKETLIDQGYHIKHKVLNTKDYTKIPHNRERIFIVGFLDENCYDKFTFPQPLNEPVLCFRDFLEPTTNKKYRYNEKSIYSKIKDDIKSEECMYQYRRYYVRSNKKGLCPTLTANMGTGGHNVPLIYEKTDNTIRKLTPRECFNFQGFPKAFKLPNLADCHLYKQAGNTVTVPLIEKLAGQVLEALTYETKKTN